MTKCVASKEQHSATGLYLYDEDDRGANDTRRDDRPAAVATKDAAADNERGSPRNVMRVQHQIDLARRHERRASSHEQRKRGQRDTRVAREHEGREQEVRAPHKDDGRRLEAHVRSHFFLIHVHANWCCAAQ